MLFVILCVMFIGTFSEKRDLSGKWCRYAVIGAMILADYFISVKLDGDIILKEIAIIVVERFFMCLCFRHSAGQILNIEGTISLFTEASNEGMFDARQFYQSQKIDFGIWVTKISRVYGKPDRYRCALQNMKKCANDVIRHSIRDDGVLSAMLLGEKGALDAEIKSLYQRAGIAHVLAISGVKTLKLDIPLVPETRINWAFVPLHIAIIYILKLCLDEEIIPRCRFPCSRGYLTKSINWQKK